MSGDMVSADTGALTSFFTAGEGYVDKLKTMYDDIEAARSAAVSVIGDGPSTLAAGPLDHLIVTATNNNGYVRELRDILLVHGAAEGLITVPASAVDAALNEAGFGNLEDLTLAEQRALAEWVETEGHVRSLNTRISAARAAGDLDLAAELEAELEAFHFDQIDPELAHTFVVSRNFIGIFGDDKANVDEFADVVDGGRRDQIYDWLELHGITGDQADVEYDRILAASQFFLDDEAALDRLDAGNDSDGNPDDDLWIDDGVANFMAATAGTDDPSEAYFRGEMIAGYIDPYSRFHADPLMDDRLLPEIYEGDSVLGPLGTDDKQAVVDGFVDWQAARILNPDSVRMYVTPVEFENEELTAALRQGYAEQAIELEVLSPVDARSQTAAHMFAGHALEGLDAEGHAEFISGLTEEYHLDGGSITGAGLFASALLYPLDLELPDNYAGMYGYGPGNEIYQIPLYTLMGLNDGLPPGGDFTQAQSDFVFVLFDQLPAWYGEKITTEDGEHFLGSELGTALGTATWPGDDQAQAYHGERLAGILMTDEGEEILAVNENVDPATRSLLIDTVLYGRMPTEPGHAYNYNTGPMPTVYWDAADFSSNNSEKVITDFAVDSARAMVIAETGQDITYTQEMYVREMAATDHGMELVGFGSNTVDYMFRNQFLSVLLAEPGWTADDLSGDGSGLNNPLVNAEMAVLWAQTTQPGIPLTAAQEQQIREIGGSDEWIDNAGIGVGVTGDTRALYLAGALENDWTSETFGLTDDFTLNEEINHWISRPHLRQFETDTERAERLAAMADGGTEPYVLAVLGDSMSGGDGLDGLHPAIAGRLDSTIEEIDAHRADGEPVNAVPVFFNTGDLQVQTYLFETTNDSGDKVYIDMAGEVYTSVNDWYNHSRLPPGQLTFTGTTEGSTSNSEFVSPLTGESYSQITFTTEDYVDTAWEHAEPWVMGGVAIIGSVVFFMNPVAGGAILTGVGAYQVGKGGYGLYQLHQHGGEIDWSDPRFRGDVLNIVEGGLTVATAGGTGLATRSAKRGYEVGRWTTRGLGAANLIEGTYSVGTVGYQAFQVLNSDLPASEKAKLLGQMGFAMTAQGLVPLAVGRGIRHLPFTTSHAYHPGISPEMYDAARAAGIDDPLHIAMYAYLNDPTTYRDPNSPTNTGVGPAVAVAGHNVGGQPYLSDVPPRLVGSGGSPAGSLNVANPSSLSLRATVETRSRSVVTSEGSIIEQEFAFIEGDNKTDYLTRLAGLYEASGTPMDGEIRANIDLYIQSHAVDTGRIDVHGEPIIEYWIPIHAIDPATGVTTVHGSAYPGTHADIVAANQALVDARQIDPDATLEDVTLLTYSRNNRHPLASCPNCSGILGDASVISGTSEAGP